MSVLEILLLGVALSMDAVAVGMTNGMVEPKMKFRKAALIAGMYGFFQFLMPVLGYYGSSALSYLVEKIAPWLSFALLLFIGGKMIVDCIGEGRRVKAELRGRQEPLGAGKLLVQAVATSIDALAVGITLLAAETTEGLPFHALLCALVIGAVTFTLSLGAVYVGKTAGDAISDKAELLGGLILVAIGVKILLEGVL